MKWACKVHTYQCPGRQIHSFSTHFLTLIPAGVRSSQITPYNLKLYFAVGVFL